MNEVKQWFLDQSPRDQVLISIGGILVVIYILLFMVLFPVQNEFAKQQHRNVAMLNEQSEVLSMAGQIMAQRDGGGGNEGDQSLNAIVNNTTREFNVRMDSLQPSGNTARVRIGESNFNNVIAWLYEMEVKRGLQVKDLSMTASAVPGSVVVQLQLVQGG